MELTDSFRADSGRIPGGIPSVFRANRTETARTENADADFFAEPEPAETRAHSLPLAQLANGLQALADWLAGPLVYPRQHKFRAAALRAAIFRRSLMSDKPTLSAMAKEIGVSPELVSRTAAAFAKRFGMPGERRRNARKGPP